MKKILIFTLIYITVFAILARAQENSAQSSAIVNAVSLPSVASPTLETEIFQLKFVQPQLVAENIREVMGSTPGGVVVIEQSRQIEVSCPSQMLEKIKTLIVNLDQEYSVALDVKIVQVDLNEEHATGINWSAIVSDYQSFSASEDKRKFSAGTVSKDDMDVLLEALETVGDTKVFPMNTVTIYNGQDADLRLKAFDRNVSVTMVPVSAIADISEKQDRYTARLLVSSTVSRDNRVNFHIASSDGTSVNVQLKNEGVAVVGGIFTQTKSESTTKFPFLGDLPVFGIVFRDQSKVVHRLENIIFMTPRIITPASDTHSK